MDKKIDAQSDKYYSEMKSLPKITFGMIVLNGEPFTRYNLRALYPYAHQIIVIEGACLAARQNATTEGHSLDGTLEILRAFKLTEDPDDKLVIVTAEDEGYGNGFWPGEKDEQSRAYAKRATGEWLWQVDSDEFYMPHDIEVVCRDYLSRPDVSGVSFKQIQFWGGLDYFVDGWYLRHRGAEEVPRLFRWGPGFSYVTHRPATVTNANGQDLRLLGWVNSKESAKKSIYMYHYSLVFPMQVRSKSKYYSNVDWGSLEKMVSWYEENYNTLKNPYRVHNVYQYVSWLERFKGMHPPQVMSLWEDAKVDKFDHPIEIRSITDIEKLLASRKYFFGRSLLRILGPIAYKSRSIANNILRFLPMKMQKTILNIWYSIRE